MVDLDSAASQPTIQLLSDGGYLVAYEKAAPKNIWIRFRYYADRSALFQAAYQNEFDAPRTLGPTAEGTPNIYSAVLNPDILHSRIQVGFHYYRDQDVDRQARGTLTNYSSWTTQVETNLNSQLEAQNIAGNIGDRDFFQFQERSYNLQEVQLTKNDMSRWRIYLYDYSTEAFTPLSIKTQKSSSSFANPTYSAITTPSGRPGFVATMFLFASGAAAGEAGSLIYFKEYVPMYYVFLPTIL